MKHSLWTAVGSALVIVPTVALCLSMSGMLTLASGHGLAEWFFDSACLVLVFVGTLMSLLLASRADRTRLPIVMSVIGGAAVMLFLVRFGLPFTR